MKKKQRPKNGYRMVCTFSTLEELVDFASLLAPTGMTLYWADALDKEFKGRVDTGSVVVRHDGHKPDDMKVC